MTDRAKERDGMADLMERLRDACRDEDLAMVRGVLRQTRIRAALVLAHEDGLVEACRAYLDAVGGGNLRALQNPQGFFVQELKRRQAVHDAAKEHARQQEARAQIGRRNATARTAERQDDADDFWARFR